MEVNKIVGALKYLEGKFGRSPSVREIAEEADCSEATALKYLQRAVGEGIIVQAENGKYMTLVVAQAFGEQKENKKGK